MSVEDRRAAIVEAALPLLIEHGANVTTSQIAAAAGIAEGTVFRAFGDKNAPELLGNRHFWCSDYMVHRRGPWMASVRMFSDRLWSSELVNDEGRRSQHLSDGANLLYLTGEGDYNAVPLSGTTNTGYVIPGTLSPLPQMSPLPTVTIGGASATVSYAGPIVGSIIGVLQMNVVVPAGSTTGAAVPVVVTVGANSTQANVTLAVHP